MKKTLLTASAGLCLTMTSCIGPNHAFDTVGTWNGRATENRWLNELIYMGLWIVPVYEIALMADSLILNSIEFWGGENPIKKPDDFVLKGGKAVDGE